QYADACNLIAISPDVVAHKLDVLRRHCDDVGRDYSQIRKTASYAGILASGDLGAFTDQMTVYAKLGLDMIIVSPLPAADPAQWIEENAAPAARRLTEIS